MLKLVVECHGEDGGDLLLALQRACCAALRKIGCTRQDLACLARTKGKA